MILGLNFPKNGSIASKGDTKLSLPLLLQVLLFKSLLKKLEIKKKDQLFMIVCFQVLCQCFLSLLDVPRLSSKNIVTRYLQAFPKFPVPSYFSIIIVPLCCIK